MATTPKKPQDYLKAEAADAPATVEFEHDGETYVIERANMNNLELFEAIEDERFITATRGFIGREQWAQFKDKYRTEDGNVPIESLEGFLQALMEAVGQGN